MSPQLSSPVSGSEQIGFGTFSSSDLPTSSPSLTDGSGDSLAEGSGEAVGEGDGPALVGRAGGVVSGRPGVEGCSKSSPRRAGFESGSGSFSEASEAIGSDGGDFDSGEARITSWGLAWVTKMPSGISGLIRGSWGDGVGVTGESDDAGFDNGDSREGSDSGEDTDTSSIEGSSGVSDRTVTK